MKRIALAATMALALTSVAKADIVDFWGFGGGGTQSPDLDYNGTAREMDQGYHIGGFVGWNQSEEIAFMADVMFAESEYEGFASSLQSLSVMLDALYVCDTGDFWRPYIAAGVGAIQLDIDRGAGPALFVSGSEWTFGYQGMAGIAFDVDESHSITLSYRYQASEDVTIGGRNVEYASHSITLGVAFD